MAMVAQPEERKPMTSTNTIFTKHLLGALFCGALAACGGSELDGTDTGEGNAFLTVVGDRNVYVEYGLQQTLKVRYHDADDQPLTGEIDFAIMGDGYGSELNRTAAVTDADGIAEIVLLAGDAEGVFTIEASAELANRAEWIVTVDAGFVPRDASGSYELDSHFDLATGMPGTAGSVLNTILDMTDDPYDPATWLIEQIDNDILNNFKGVVAPLLYDLIQQQAPGFVGDLIEMGNHLGDIMRHYGLQSQLDVRAGDDVEGGDYVATHVVTGFAFEIDGVSTYYLMEELGASRPTVEGIGFAYDENTARAVIAQHDITVPYGAAIGLALEEVIIPLIDPSASDLHSLLAGAVDCQTFGQRVASELGFGSAATYTAVCQDGLNKASGFVMDQIYGIDQRAPVVLRVDGTAVAKDANRDGTVDSLTRGKWNGLIDYAGQAAELAGADDANTFAGKRMD